MRPIFVRYPALTATLPIEEIGLFPTPVRKLDGISSVRNCDHLYVKRDDLSGTPYGGNKVRKLEFLLAAAKKAGATRVITSGAAGSNHALATAIYATACGFDVTLMLFDQPFNPAIPKTLLADFATGAELVIDKEFPEHVRHIATKMEEYTQFEGKAPYLIPAGGSSPLGTIGYVNAAFELQEQIHAGLLPQPEAVFCALGTMGTAAGLLVGMQAAGLHCKLVGVRVVPAVVASLEKVRTLFDACTALLHKLDPAFPLCTFDPQQFMLEENYFGDGYGIPTSEALAAIELFSKQKECALDPIYTGKAAAAFLAHAQNRQQKSMPLLFIDSKSSHFPDTAITMNAYRQLPAGLHHYFIHAEEKNIPWVST